MKRTALFFLLGTLAFSPLCAAAPTMGIVNFKLCVEKSRSGQQEKNAFEALKRQMTEALEKSGKELESLAKKLEDPDYMDGLSPSAELDLKQKFQNLNQEFNRNQNQFYQILNQANFRMLQALHQQVAQAADTLREKNNLAVVLNEESVFAYASELDITEGVIQEMDRTYQKKVAESTGSPGVSDAA